MVGGGVRRPWGSSRTGDVSASNTIQSSTQFTLHVGITRTKGEGTSSNPEELPPVPVIELWCHPFRESTCEDTKIPTLPTRTRQVSDRSLTSGLQRLPIRSNHHGCVTSLTSRPHAYTLHFSNN